MIIATSYQAMSFSVPFFLIFPLPFYPPFFHVVQFWEQRANNTLFFPPPFLPHTLFPPIHSAAVCVSHILFAHICGHIFCSWAKWRGTQEASLSIGRHESKQIAFQSEESSFIFSLNAERADCWDASPAHT